MQGRTHDHLLQRLRSLREARGLTQEQFAETHGISYKYYQQVESGRKLDLRLSTLERLANAHGLEVWELLMPAPFRPKSVKPATKPSTKRRSKS